MISAKEDKIIHMIYNAVLNHKWNDVISQIAIDIHADFGLISFLDQLNPSANLTYHYNGPHKIVKLFNSIDVKLLDKQAHGHFAQTYGIGNAINIDWLHYYSYPKDSPEKKLYDLVISPCDVRYGNVTLLESEPYYRGFIGIYRKSNALKFTRQECKKLESFALHLRRAWQIYRQFSSIQKQVQNHYAILNHLNIAVIVVNSKCQLIYSNHMAQNILQSSLILSLDTNSRLKTSKYQQNELDQMIRSIFEGSWSQHIGDTLILYQQPEEPLLQLSITPFIQNCTINDLSDRAVIFITQVPKYYRLSVLLLNKNYDLSLREIQICELFINGFNLNKICEQLKIKKSSLRTYFKNIYKKTNSTSQSELLYLLLKTLVHFEHVSS